MALNVANEELMVASCMQCHVCSARPELDMNIGFIREFSGIGLHRILRDINLWIGLDWVK